MLTYVPIANLSLQHIGEDDRISAPDENSRAARIVKRAWDATALFVLSQANWSFATRTVELTARVADPEWPIALGRKAFPLPSDMVRLVEIVDPDLNDEPDSYSIEGGPTGQELLVDDAGPITIRYVRFAADFLDPTRWPPAFVEAFAWRLAWQISDALAADKPRKDRAFNAAEAALRTARRVNNKTKGTKGEATTPWSAARHCSTVRAPGT